MQVIFASRSKAKAKPQRRDSASSSTRTFPQRKNLDQSWTKRTVNLRLWSVEEIDSSSSSWKSTSKRWWSDWILENQRQSSETCFVLSLVWRKVEEKHDKRRRKPEETPVLHLFIKMNLVPPSSSRSFRTQSHWSYFTGQCHYSGRFLQVHLSCRMCNQFTFHHQFRIDIGRTKFEQQTDNILFACGSHGQRT